VFRYACGNPGRTHSNLLKCDKVGGWLFNSLYFGRKQTFEESSLTLVRAVFVGDGGECLINRSVLKARRPLDIVGSYSCSVDKL